MQRGLTKNEGKENKGEKAALSFDEKKPRRTPSEIIKDLEEFKYNYYKEKYINA